MPSILLAARMIVVSVLLLFCACGQFETLWHDQRLPSGRTVKVTSCMFVWGIEHDVRTPENDSFALEFAYTAPNLSYSAREQEAREAFELIRSTSELWLLKRASVAGFPTTKRKGRYDLFLFERASDGRWSFKRTPEKVFIND